MSNVMASPYAPSMRADSLKIRTTIIQPSIRIQFMAVMEGDEKFPNGHPMMAPPAMQQGELLAENLDRLIHNKPLKPFRYKDKGAMATVGRNKAVVDLKKLRFQGFFAWFVWMFVHLLSLIGFRNKLIVFINWFVSYFSYDKSNRLIIARPKDGVQ